MAARFGALRASYFRERMDAIPGPASPLTVSYQLPWWITSPSGRRLGLAMGRSGRSAG